jgi:hypothetical protein
MATQITARNQGDDYQARWFWLQACSLLDPSSHVERVCYEENNLRSLDDVVVYYRDGKKDKYGQPQKADFYQVKFHVTSGGAITAIALTEPSFIGATTHSLLQRLLNAYRKCQPDYVGYRFHLYTPWIVHPDDPLAGAHSQADGSIRWDKLSQGKFRSAMGEIRKLWMDHLSLTDEEELHRLLGTICIQQGPTLKDLGLNLNYRLAAVGLRPVDECVLGHPYDELTRKMLAAGIHELDKIQLLDLCKREGRWVGSPVRQADVKVLGIRTFTKYAEDLQNQTDALLCLARYFDGRTIKDQTAWHGAIRRELEVFVSQQFTRRSEYVLHLDTHSSIAFAAGNLLRV